ncbi:hypothetical protein ABPG77_004195 [Micractinium sp. CCAP 211/92]
MYAKVEEVEGGFAPILKIKNVGRVDLGVYSTARKAAVAHDVARLICLHEKRPETDLRMDTGLMHPTEGYLCDPFFKQLLTAKTSFESVCELLRSGALVDSFLTAQDRQTRSSSSGDRAAPAARPQQQLPPQRSGSGLTAPRPAGHAPAEPPAAGHAPAEPPAATQQEAAPPCNQAQQQSHKSSADTQQALPPPSALQGAGGAAAAAQPPSASGSPTQDTAGAADAAAGGPSPPKKKAVRWLEWPVGMGQYVTLISDRALKSSMTLPVKMKRELFQVTESPARVDAYDLLPGSTQRWSWEVRDYVKDERRVTSIHSLGPFFRHYQAVAGDVMVVVASAPGAVKACVWKADSKEAAEFKAFQDRQTERQGRAAVAGAARKRVADGPPLKTAAKAAKPGAAKAGAVAAQGGAPALAPESSRPISKSSSGLHKHGSEPQTASGQQSPQRQAGGALPPPARPPQHGAASVAGADKAPPRVAAPQPRCGALLALAESGVDPSHPSADDTQALSPTGQVAQSPYRHGTLPPGLSAAVGIKQEQQERGSPLPAVQEGMELDQQAGTVPGAAPDGSAPAVLGGAAGDATHSPARMSCADASQLLGGAGAAPAGGAAVAQQRLQQQHQALSQPAASGAGAVGLQVQAAELPDPLVLAGDEAGVYVAMGRLLGLVASTGHVPTEAVAAYRRSFMRLDPHGKRWFAYDSLKQLVDSGEWADVHEWLLCNLGLSAVAHTSGEGITDATWSGAGDAESALPARDGEESHGGLQQAQPPPPPRPRPLPDLGALPHLFVSFGNAAYFDLAHNWARSVQALRVSYILAAFDSDMMGLCAATGLVCSKVEFGQADNFRGNFSAFRAMGAVKVRFVLGILEQHPSLPLVVVSDTDTVWLRQPWPYFEQRPATEFFISTDCLSHELEDRWQPHALPRCGHIPGNAGGASAYNTGMFAVRNTAGARGLLKAWADMLTDPGTERANDPMHRAIDDQLAMNVILESGGRPAASKEDNRTTRALNGTLLLQALPVVLFSNGHVAYVQRTPWRLGVAPIVVHATFQRNGLPGKVARMREFGLWHIDPPEYFGDGNATLRLLTYQNPVLSFVTEAERELYAPQGRRMPLFEKHWLAMSYQLAALRDALAAAAILGRTVVLPQLWCWCDSDEHPHILERCRIRGTDYMTPFVCPLDFLVAPGALEYFGFQWRHAGFLDQPQVPAWLRHSRALVRIADSRPEPAFLEARQMVGHAAVVWPGIRGSELKRAVQHVDSAAVLELRGTVPGFLGGWDAEQASAATAFDKSFADMAQSAQWCCFAWGRAPPEHTLFDYARPPPLAAPWQPWKRPRLELPDWCDKVSEKDGNREFTRLPQHPCAFMRNATAAALAADDSGAYNVPWTALHG